MKWWRRRIVWNDASLVIISYLTQIVPRAHRASYDAHFHVHIRGTTTK